MLRYRFVCYVTFLFSGWKCYVIALFSGWKCYVMAMFSRWKYYVIALLSGWKVEMPRYRYVFRVEMLRDLFVFRVEMPRYRYVFRMEMLRYGFVFRVEMLPCLPWEKCFPADGETGGLIDIYIYLYICMYVCVSLIFRFLFSHVCATNIECCHLMSVFARIQWEETCLRCIWTASMWGSRSIRMVGGFADCWWSRSLLRDLSMVLQVPERPWKSGRSHANFWRQVTELFLRPRHHGDLWLDAFFWEF